MLDWVVAKNSFFCPNIFFVLKSVTSLDFTYCFQSVHMMALIHLSLCFQNSRVLKNLCRKKRTSYCVSVCVKIIELKRHRCGYVSLPNLCSKTGQYHIFKTNETENYKQFFLNYFLCWWKFSKLHLRIFSHKWCGECWMRCGNCSKRDLFSVNS